MLKPEEKKISHLKIVLLFLLTIVIVSASIIISVTLTVCCLMNKNETLEYLITNGNKYLHGAVASDQEMCSVVGVNVLKENGTAVDAAVATSICLGVVNMHSSGIGGGGIMIVHLPHTLNTSKRAISSQTIVYDYRETVPAKLMQVLNTTDPSLLALGGLSIAVPGEIAGLYLAWKNHGRLPWKRLFEPSINLCLHGIPLHRRLYEASNFMKYIIFSDYGFKSLLFINDTVKEKDSLFKNLLLAETLTKISENPESFYNGSLAKDIVNDMKGVNGLIQLEDLNNYKVLVKETTDFNMSNGLTLKSAPLPFSGPIVNFILNVLQGFNITAEDFATKEKSALTLHRMVEAMKFAFAKRTLFGDPNFMNATETTNLLNELSDPKHGELIRRKIQNITHNISFYDPLFIQPSNSGTTHVSILAADGSAVSMTSSINIWFGSGYRSNTTGIVYNNHIDDFSIPNRTNSYKLKPSPANMIQAGKRPLSSISPIMVMENDNLRMILGGSGGTRIISSVASILTYKLFLNDTLRRAIYRPRVHNQLTPNKIIVEEKYPVNPQIINILKNKYGHEIGYTTVPEYSSVQAIYIGYKNIYAESDPRKYGVAEGY